MDLDEKVKKFETKEGAHCLKCGNKWYFVKVVTVECTTCGAKYFWIPSEEEADGPIGRDISTTEPRD